LKRHACEDLKRRVDVSNFIAEKLNTPLFSVFLDVLDNLHVDLVTLLECLIESQLTDLTTHRGLSQVDDGFSVVLDVVARLLWVNHLDVDDTIDLNKHVILGDSGLLRDLNHLFSKIMHVLDLIDEGDLKV